VLIQDYHFSPNTKSESDLTPIEIAVMTGSIDCLQLLLSLGADPKPLADQDLFTEVAITGSRGTPTRSVATGNRILLSTIAGIVSNMHSDGERSGEPCAAVQDLLNGRYQVDDGDIGQSGSPLELCISASNYDSVVALLGLGTNPNSINHTPSLHLTVSLREPVLVALLLAYGANPNLKGGVAVNEETALHQADVKSETMVHDLHRNAVTSYKKHLSKDVNPVETDSQFAILARTKACIDILLFNGADIEAQDRNGDTPLMLRVLQGDLETAQYLLDKGANLHAKDFDGMEVSDKVDSPEVLEWCIKFGPALATRHSSSLVKPATIA
jgi:ankyrin repeat protein